MPFVYREEREQVHHCDKPRATRVDLDAVTGDVWRCSECGRFWRYYGQGFPEWDALEGRALTRWLGKHPELIMLRTQ